MNNRRMWLLAWGGALAAGLAAHGQGDAPDCSDDPYPLPASVTIRPAPPPEIATAADCDIAAGLTREVTATNAGVGLRCKTGQPRPGATGTVPLFGAGLDLNQALFRQTPELVGDAISQMYDSKVIYDGFADRFWIVTLESGYADGTGLGTGRVHVAVSTTGSPDNFSWAPCPIGDPLHPECAGSWYKYTEGGTAPQFDLSAAGLPGGEANRFVPDAIPDVASIAVDETYIYMAIREAAFDGDLSNDRTMIVVATKDKFMAGDPNDPPVIEMNKFIEVGVTARWAHQLAVDFDIENEPPPKKHKVYMISLPTVPVRGQLYTSIRLGTFRKTNNNNANSWTYKGTNLALPITLRFRGASTNAPGGDGDFNDINASIFRGAVTRLVNGERKIWAVHHVRQTNVNDLVAKLQWYEITPNDYPTAMPDVLSTDTVRRLDLSPAWAHDPSIGVNSCGDRAISFTKAVGDSGYPEFYVWLCPAAGDEGLEPVQAGASSKYYESGGNFWADYSGTVADPTDDALFWGHSIVVHDDGSMEAFSEQWESIIAQYSMHSCGGRPGSDFNLDGTTDLTDLLLFHNLYERGAPAADLNGDGYSDALDYLVILDAAYR